MLCKLFLAVQQIIQNLNSQTADIGYLIQCMRIRILGAGHKLVDSAWRSPMSLQLNCQLDLVSKAHISMGGSTSKVTQEAVARASFSSQIGLSAGLF